jgi:photosystem II stability/assembly factor-like uncharacterized protein
VDDLTKSSPTAFSFVDEAYGWLVGDRAQAYQTTDGATSWQPRGPQFRRVIKVHQPPRIRFREVKFFSRSSGYLIVEVNPAQPPEGTSISYLRKLLVLRTGDGGRQWEIRAKLKAPTFIRAQFLSEKEWWVQTASREALLHTTDAGKSWSEIRVSADPSIGPMVFLDSRMGWLLSFSSGFHGDNLLTLDGGNTWTVQKIKYVTEGQG